MRGMLGPVIGDPKRPRDDGYPAHQMSVLAAYRHHAVHRSIFLLAARGGLSWRPLSYQTERALPPVARAASPYRMTVVYIDRHGFL